MTDTMDSQAREIAETDVFDDGPATGMGSDGNIHDDPSCAMIAPFGSYESRHGELCGRCEDRQRTYAGADVDPDYEAMVADLDARKVDRIMTPRTIIDQAETSEDAIRELSEELALTNLEAVELMERYHALKVDAPVIDPTTGEKLSQAEYKKAIEDLNAELKAHITRTGEPLTREGLPDLILKPSSTTWYRLRTIFTDEPDMFDFLMDNGLIDVKASAKKLAETAPALMGLSKYAVQGEGTPRLEFERRR